MADQSQWIGQQRVVRVFVSSTFRDMHEEREELVKRIFPQLRKLCEERGVTWGEVDLRWGITREQAERGEVLPVCLEEIHRCRPYFIGLLGERYGWVPEEIPPDLIEREGWLAEHRNQSVTELEILHGVLNNPEMADHAFFYFRDPSFADTVPQAEWEDFREMGTQEEIDRFGFQEGLRRAIERSDRLNQLKARIRTSGFPVRENFKDARALGQLVLKDLTELIDGQYPQGSEPDVVDRELTDHEIFAASRTHVYVARREYFEQLTAHVAGDGPPLVVTGESGSGKSALLANWALWYRHWHPDELVVMHFAGATSLSARWDAMLLRILIELKGRFHIELPVPDYKQLTSEFASWLNEAAKRGRIVIVVDALDQLEDRDGAPDLVWLPAQIPPGVRFIFSTLEGRPLEELKRRQCSTLAVSPLNQDERQKLLEDYLAQYTKRLSAEHARRIAAAPAAGNPLYLRALLEELRLYGDHQTLDERINHNLEAQDAASLYQKILARYEQDYERDRPHLVRDAMSLLWAARRGLSEAELLDMLGTNGEPLPRAYWSPLYLALEPALINREGVLGFLHNYLREAVGERYLGGEALGRDAHRRLANYFAGRELRQRKVEELPWQLARIEDWEVLRDVLADLEFFLLAWRMNKYDVQSYWAQVEANTPLRLIDAYRDVLDKPEHHSEHLSHLAGLFITAGYHREAQALRGHLVEHYRKVGDHQNLQSELALRANLLAMRGDLKRAADLLEEEEQVARTSGRTYEQQFLSLHTRATILVERGEAIEALALLKETERLAREQGDKEGLSTSLSNQANIMTSQHDFDGAHATYLEVERLKREVGDKDGLQLALFNRAYLLQQHGDRSGALSLMAEQELLCREIGEKTLLAASLFQQGALMTMSGGDRALAKVKCEEALALFRELEMPVEVKKTLNALRVIESGISVNLMKALMIAVLFLVIAGAVALGLWRPWLWLISGPVILVALVVFLMNFVAPVREAFERAYKQDQADMERESQ